MGVDYTFHLRVGYSLSEDMVVKPYSKHFETKFHYEDRFDCKTGKKLKSVKIIDQRGGNYLELEYDGQVYKDLIEIVQETSFFQDKFNCEVSYPFNCSEPPKIVNFYLDLPQTYTNEVCSGKVTVIGADIPLSWLDESKNKLFELKSKLEKEFDINNIGEPKIFIESWIG